MQIKKLPANALFFFVFIIIAVTYYSELVLKYPFGIHAWAQSDRLALAIGFYDNGMNFFLPTTYSLLPEKGITGVEFPIQSYIAAVMGKIFGREYISVSFRVLDTIVSLIGMWFLFKAVYKRTQDFIFSLLPPLFIFCSPVFIYYTCSYIPDTASASLVFIAFYYILNFIDGHKNKDAVIAIIVLMFAALIKTSAAIYLLGFSGFVFLHKLFIEKKRTVNTYIPVLISSLFALGALFAYYRYNAYLNGKYNSGIFLAAVKPFEDMDKFNYFINQQLKDVFLKEYFVLPEYLLLFAIAAPGIAYLFKNKHGRSLLLQAGIFLAGTIGISVLLGSQLIGHDYYAIVIFFPTIIFLLLICTIEIKNNITSDTALKPVKTALIASMVTIYLFANYQINQRLYPDYHPFYPGKVWAENGKQLLDSLNVSKDEHLFLFDEESPNLGLLYFDRKGYTMNKEWWNGNASTAVNFMKEKKLSIMITRASKQELLKNEHNDILKQFSLLGVNDSILVYKLAEQ